MFVYVIYSLDKKFLYEVFFDEQKCIDTLVNDYDVLKCDYSAISFDRLLSLL